jgi:hypothetical protein
MQIILTHNGINNGSQLQSQPDNGHDEMITDWPH